MHGTNRNCHNPNLFAPAERHDIFEYDERDALSRRPYHRWDAHIESKRAGSLISTTKDSLFLNLALEIQKCENEGSQREKELGVTLT